MFIFSAFLHNVSYANVQINATRVIFDGKKNEETILVKNIDNKTPNLIQSWVSAENDSDSNDFVIVPPLFRLEGNEEATLRIKLLNKSLPQDKESLFWLSVKNIAPTDINSKNKLLINFRTKIKLIYRPVSISKDKEIVFNAFKKIEIHKSNDGFKLINPTPYYINFNRIQIDSKDVVKPGYIAPFGNKFYQGYTGNIIKWQVINDYGGVSDFYSTNL